MLSLKVLSIIPWRSLARLERTDMAEAEAKIISLLSSLISSISASTPATACTFWLFAFTISVLLAEVAGTIETSEATEASATTAVSSELSTFWLLGKKEMLLPVDTVRFITCPLKSLSAMVLPMF